MNEATDEEPAPRKVSFVELEREHRLEKIEELRQRGISPYPPTFARDHTAADVRDEFDPIGVGEVSPDRVMVAGRLHLIRNHGGIIFASLRDQSGVLQVAFERDRMDSRGLLDARGLDRGDWVGIEGSPMRSRSGELTVTADTVTMLSKSLRALPDKHRGLTDTDTRLRERYLDLIANPGVRPIFDIRSQVIASVRNTLIGNGFIEVETPVLASQAGGAAARPFITHHNALGIDMYLRIALELPLKRLMVGGFERVFEIGRVFRNEGLDPRHNPEFTLLEAYQALGDYHAMMDLVEQICSNAALEAIGRTGILVGGQKVDLKTPWRRVTMTDLILEVTGETMHPSMPVEEARAICDRHGVGYEHFWGAGRLMAEVADECCEHTMLQPTIVCDYPQEVSPLAKVHRDDPFLTERFEVVVAGRELANAYSELNDPVDQKARFEEEAKAAAQGDDEAESVDDDYVRALEYGLPPTGGLGIGLDRLIMLISEQQSIRDVLLFPAMRPADGGTGPSLSAATLPTAAELAPPAELAPSRTAAAGTPAAEATAATGITDEDDLDPATRRGTDAAPVPAATGTKARRALGWLTAIAGIGYLLTAIPSLDSTLGLGTILGSGGGRVTGHVAAVVIGLVLLVIAGRLRQGKRRAWLVALLLFAIAAIAHTLRGPDPIVVVYSLGMMGALAWFRDSFGGRPDPATLLDALRFVPLYLLAVFIFSFGTMLLERDHIPEALSFGGMLETTVVGLAGIDGPYTYQGRFLSDFFPAALFALGIAGLVLFALLIFRAVALRSAPSANDRRQAADLVHRYGSGTLDYFALRDDKSYFFTARGDAMIAFTYISGYALVAADPIGAPGSKDRVVDQFIAFCRERNWKVAFLAVREADAGFYADRGFRSVYLGDEAIIPCDRFNLEGSRM